MHRKKKNNFPSSYIGIVFIGSHGYTCKNPLPFYTENLTLSHINPSDDGLGRTQILHGKTQNAEPIAKSGINTKSRARYPYPVMPWSPESQAKKKICGILCHTSRLSTLAFRVPPPLVGINIKTPQPYILFFFFFTFTEAELRTLARLARTTNQ